jgi:phage protein D
MVQYAYSNVIDVRFGGAKLPKEYARMLVDGRIDQGVGVPAAFRLTFRDPYRLLLGKLKVTFGTKVVIAPVSNGKGASDPLLTGEVTGLEADYDGTGSFAVVRGYDAGFRLTRQRRVMAYKNQTASDIARKLARQDGVTIGRIDRTRTVYDFISQAHVTDWDFLARLADENEMAMSIDAKGKFQFVKPKPSSGAPSPKTDGDKNTFVLEAGHDIIRLRTAVTAADQVATVESRGWDVTTRTTLKTTKPARSYPGVDIGTTPAKAAGKFPKATLVETDVPRTKQAQVRSAANALADDVTSAFAELEAVVRGNPKLRPGVPVALADVGTPFEGKYTVTSVRHVFGDQRHYESWVTVSGRQWRSLYGLASGGADAAGARQYSVANAVVTDVKDPLRQGRVKLRFPWLDDRYVSDWTRTMQWGGVRGGGVFPMDVGDEVLVAFDRGALDHAFVIGGLYNGKDKPTQVKDVQLYSARGQATRHTVSDRSGNRLDLLDQKIAAGKQGVRLASGDDKLTVYLDRTKTEIVVDSAGKVTIKGTSTVDVQAGADLSLTAGGNLSIKSGLAAGAALNMEAGGEATLSAAGTVQVDAVADVGIRGVTVPIMGVVTIDGVPVPV